MSVKSVQESRDDGKITIDFSRTDLDYWLQPLRYDGQTCSPDHQAATCRLLHAALDPQRISKIAPSVFEKMTKEQWFLPYGFTSLAQRYSSFVISYRGHEKSIATNYIFPKLTQQDFLDPELIDGGLFYHIVKNHHPTMTARSMRSLSQLPPEFIDSLTKQDWLSVADGQEESPIYMLAGRKDGLKDVPEKIRAALTLNDWLDPEKPFAKTLIYKAIKGENFDDIPVNILMNALISRRVLVNRANPNLNITRIQYHIDSADLWHHFWSHHAWNNDLVYFNNVWENCILKSCKTEKNIKAFQQARDMIILTLLRKKPKMKIKRNPKPV